MKRSAAAVPFAGNLTVLRADYASQLKATTWLAPAATMTGPTILRNLTLLLRASILMTN